MPDKPMLFSGPMVRAILAGRKTVTRRIVKPQPKWNDPKHYSVFEPDFARGASWRGEWTWWGGNHTRSCYHSAKSPCAVGDLLWVREACRGEELESGQDGVRYLADGAFVPIKNSPEAAARWGDLRHYRKKRGATVPPIHMPRWASRISLRVVSVWAERVRDITDEEAAREGIFSMPEDFKQQCVRLALTRGVERSTAGWQFACLWESIHGPGAWNRNEWVWRIEFERIAHADPA